MTDEYISREAALEAFENADADVYEDYGDGTVDWGFGRKNIQNVINGIPAADVVEVVRCKDCKYFGRELENGKHDCTDFNLLYCSPDDFCSHGVRTDGENEKKPARENGQTE